MRWIEQGIYWPRFSIHSSNDDGSVTEPWMYPDLLPQVRAALEWRERLVPLMYTLLWRAHARHEPVLRPLFFDFPDSPRAYAEQDCFMVGPDLLVAPILDRGSTGRTVWLPEVAGGWFDIRDGANFGEGAVEVAAALGAAPAFVRAGSILPLGPTPSWEEGPLTLRLFPRSGGVATTEIFDDDGESHVDHRAPPCLLQIEARWQRGETELDIRRLGPRPPRWREIRLEDAAGRPLEARMNGRPLASVIPLDAIAADGK